MRKTALLATVAVTLAAAGSGAALASSLGRPCTAAPQSEWLSMQQLRAKVEALGYSVRKTKLKDACGEMYSVGKNGARVELFVDPTDGKIVGQH